jgi:hypothetical protein
MNTLEEKHELEQGRAPLFVVGMWRSGTSLFYALLNQHPQIKLMYEDELPLLWPLFLGGRARADWRERWEFWNQALSRHKLKLDDLPRDVPGLREACQAAWSAYAPEGAIRGGKSPSYFDCLPRIAEEFPEAKFLVVWRDPADVCRSVMRARSDSFFAKRGMFLRALLGCRDLKHGYDVLVARGVQVHSVQYEDLVADPAAVMQDVCGFLDIAFDRRMASLHGADRSAIYDAGHHEMVNSEKIIAGHKKPEVLPAEIRHKIDCYIAHWRRESGGAWPSLTESETPSAAPGIGFAFERIVDRVLYRSLRTFDQLIAFLYCYLPIEILRNYRTAKAGSVAGPRSEKPISEKEMVGAVQKQ